MIGFQADLFVSFVTAGLVMIFAILVGFGVQKFNHALISNFNPKIMRFVLNRVMFVGTIFHELSHALFAVLTGAKVLKMKCFALFDPDRLGYVEFAYRGGRIKQALQASCIACAPVMTGFLTVPWFVRFALFSDYGWGAKLVCFYVALSIICHMSMSKADLKLYLKGCLVLLPLLTLVILCVRFLLRF